MHSEDSVPPVKGRNDSAERLAERIEAEAHTSLLSAESTGDAVTANRMETQKPFRFAVLLEGAQLNQWQAECVSRLVASGGARLELIIKVAARSERFLRKSISLLRHALWQAYLFTLRRRSWIGAADPRLFRNVEVFACEAYGNDRLLELRDYQTEQIRSRRFDFILHFGDSTPADSWSTIAVEGIWCFRYGKALEPAAPLSAFKAAVLRGDNVVRVELVRFNDGVPAGCEILRDGYFAAPYYSFKKTLTGILKGSVDLPVLACRDLLVGRRLRKAQADSNSAHDAAEMPTNLAMFQFLIRILARKAVGLFYLLLTRVQWNTGFLDSALLDPFSITTARDVRWLPADSAKDFAADPFFLRRDEKVTLLVEKLDPVNNCGRIAAHQFDGNEIVPLGTAIEEPVHLSYPCLVQSQGQIYCIPEQAEARSIMLYRAIDFPLLWERLGPLLADVDAVDSTLFQHGGYWWLSYTDAGIDRNGRLLLWYASELTGAWQPHALNPVKIDPRCSRGAGPPFVYRGALVRPSQDCSVNYGAKIIFNRIITLTPDEFQEEIIGELRPDPAGPYSSGLHTISYDGRIAIIDGKRSVFDLTALLAKARGRMRRHGIEHLAPARKSQYSLS
jgi:hypothetical protein